MTQARDLLSNTVRAAGAIAEGRCVTFGGAQVSAQGDKILGVARADAEAGKLLAVTVIGTAIVESGAQIAVGDSLICDNQGRAMPSTGALAVAAGATPVTSGAANGAAVLEGADLPEFIFADALQAAAGPGQRIEVLLRR
ncbi:MAG: DUF2190 family protein [Magnetospirillum sp. WYHS-4]